MDPNDPLYCDESHTDFDDDGLPEVDEDRGDELPNADVWPELKWRGDLTKRHMTAGTLLAVIAANGGDQNEFGVPISTVELELRRVAAKYGGKNSGDPGYGKTVNGDSLYTSMAEIRQMVHGMVTTSGVLEYRDRATAPLDQTRVRLTADGAALYENAYVAAQKDRRFEHIDLSDPILEVDVTSSGPGTTVETLAIRESVLPLMRNIEQRPYFRSWLWIVSHNPVTWAVLKSKTDPNLPELYRTGALEGYDHIAAAFADASKTPIVGGSLPIDYWAARMQAETIRPFARQVLSGGPDGMWIGRPLKPEELHLDVESLAAAGVPGFDTKMIQASSLAWEIYADSEFTLSEYSAMREAMNAAQRDSSTITVSFLEEPEDFSTEEKSDEKSATSGDAKSETDKKLDKAKLGVGKKGITGERTVERLVMKKSSEALMDMALGREVANIDEAGRIGKLLRVRCDYVLQSKDANKRRACDKWSVGGSTRCEIHGGEYLDPEETRSVLAAGRSKLTALSSAAVDTLADLMTNSTNDPTRMAAAKTILQLAGFNEKLEVAVTVDTGQSPADVIAERLARLAPKANELEAAESEAERGKTLFAEDAVVEAEVVEEEQPPF